MGSLIGPLLRFKLLRTGPSLSDHVVDNCCCLGSWSSAAAEDTRLSSNLAQSSHKVYTGTEATASDEASAACVVPNAGLDTSSGVW